MTIGRKIEAAAPWATGLLLAAPCLIAFYPPMSDLPFHEAAIGILRHFNDVSMFPQGLYRRNLGEPNQLFHMVGWALSYVLPLRWVIKLTVAATIVALPPSAARLARYVGASPLSALLVAPLAIGWLFYWGLVTNLIGLAAALAVLPGLDRFARSPSWRGALGTCGAVVLLYFAHEAMMFLYAAAALGLALLYPWSPRKTAMRVVPFVFAMMAAIAQVKWQVRFMSPTLRAMPRMWSSFAHKLEGIPALISPTRDWVVLAAMSTLCGVTLVSFFWLRARERRRGPIEQHGQETRGERIRRWLLAWRWEAFALACFAAYFTFPLSLNGATFVYQRWFPPGFAVLAIVAAPRDLFVREARAALVAIGAFPIATLLLAWPSFADSDRSYRALEPLIGQVELGSSIATIDLGPPDPSRTFSVGPAAGRILGARGGRLVYAFTDSSISPVVLSSRYGWNESLVRVGFDSFSFRPGQDMHRYKYLLVRANDPPLTLLAIRALTPDAEFVDEGQEWMLFKSRWPTPSLLARDFWLNGPPPENMRQIFDEILKSAHDAEAQAGDPSCSAPLPAKP